MAEGVRIVELLLEDFKTASVSSVAYELDISASDAAKIVEAYARERSGYTLVYSVCFRDNQDNTIVSHVPESKLQELVANYGYVNFQLAAIHDSLLEFDSFSHADFKRELDVVYRKLVDAQVRNDLYIPSYCSIKANGLRLRKFDVPQGALVKHDVPKSSVSSGPETKTPERRVPSRPSTTSRLTMDSFATSKRSGVGNNGGRSATGLTSDVFCGQSRPFTASRVQGQSFSDSKVPSRPFTDARVQGGALKTPINSHGTLNGASGGAFSTSSAVGAGAASDVSGSRVQGGALITPKGSDRVLGEAVANGVDTCHPLTSPKSEHKTAATATLDSTNVSASLASDGSLVSEKRQRVDDNATLWSNSSAAASNTCTGGNLFDLDDPTVYEDGNSKLQEAKEVTYVEKRVKQDTYIEDGYFVIEDKDEYVAVKRKVESPKRKIGGPKSGHTCKPDKVEIKSPHTDSVGVFRPIVALVGRPNVGKSALFNRISARFHRGSIVSDEPGTTRDRQYALADWAGVPLRLIDTGGLDPDGLFADEVKSQIKAALKEAHVAIVVVDGQDGVLNADLNVRDLVFEVKRENKNLRIFLCVNKCESWRMGSVLAQDFWQLGLGQPYAASALHGSGVGDLMDACVDVWRRQDEDEEGLQVTEEEERDIRIALVGRQNCGKSSLINYMSKTQRCIVSDVKGTTLDTVHVPIEYDESRITLIDTAGMQLVSKSRCLFLPQNRSLRAIRQADVVVLVLDATFGISKNDLAIANEIKNEYKAALIVCNKWDLLDKDATLYKNAVAYIKEKLSALSFADILFTSASTGKRVDLILHACKLAYKQYSRNFSTALLNELLQDAAYMQKPPIVHGKRAALYYCTQVHTRPPGIALFCNDDELLTPDYLEYLQVYFCKNLKLNGSPIKWYPRKKRARHLVKEMRNRNGPKFDPNELLTL